MSVIIETDRLMLRTFTINDVDLIYDLNRDDEVMRFTYSAIRHFSKAAEILEKVILPQYVFMIMAGGSSI